MNRRDRSRSPNRSGRRRDRSERNAKKENLNDSKSNENNEMLNNSNPMMNSMMMNNMYQQGNMLMSSMFPNMMMQNQMMGNNMGMPAASMDMMQANGMDMMPQNSMMTQNSIMPQNSVMPQSSMEVSMPHQQTQPMIGQTQPMMAQTQPMMGQTQPMMGQTQPMMGQTQPMMAQTQPMIGPTNDMPMMGGMMMDPSQMAIYQGMSQGQDMAFVEKKEIVLKHIRLIPPTPGSDPPPQRPKPPGCRTIFIGGLPDKVRESHVREIFENYGRISTLRLSTKNFCHIRFEKEMSVDNAMQLSGYQIKVITGKEEDDKDETKATTGWLHVDYALSRDDQNDFERRQRQVMRAQEAQMQQLTAQQKALAAQSMGMNMSVPMDMERSYRRSPSPPTIQPFSHGAIVHLAEKIKSEEHFAANVHTLVAWLERGECSKRNSTQFYAMLQATNSHIRRLFNEKMQAEEEFHETKEKIKRVIQAVIDQLEQVGKVFAAATHQRVWDHFTKPQRKNIETWQRMTQEFAAMKEEFNERFNDDDYGYGNMNSNALMNNGEVDQLKVENESLKFQLEAYKNEVDVLKADANRDMEKIKAQMIARQALLNIDNQPPLPLPIKKPPPPPPTPDDVPPSKVEFKETVDPGCGEAKLIGIMSAFLQVHPQGASLDYVVSYVRALFPSINQSIVHNVLQKHADVFEKSTTGVGANIEHRWNFVAFKLKQETA